MVVVVVVVVLQLLLLQLLLVELLLKMLVVVVLLAIRRFHQAIGRADAANRRCHRRRRAHCVVSTFTSLN